MSGLRPSFGRIGGPECPVCLGQGLRCHPDGGLIACVEGCERCDAAVEQRCRAIQEAMGERPPLTDDDAMRLLASLYEEEEPTP